MKLLERQLRLFVRLKYEVWGGGIAQRIALLLPDLIALDLSPSSDFFKEKNLVLMLINHSAVLRVRVEKAI